MTYIIYPEQVKLTNQSGGKARSLAALRDTGLLIPPWFVLSPAAFYDSLSDIQRQALSKATDSAEILALLDHLYPAPAVQSELACALVDLAPNYEFVAVRSSAPDEDGTQHSFAGQLDSFLNVPPAEVAGKVVDVWRSGFSERVLAYRRERGLNSIPSAPAVLIQRMVNAGASGVAFSADPLTGQENVVISAVSGLGTALVSGEADADTFRVEPNGHILERNLELTINNYPLTTSQIQAIAAMARLAAQIFGCPQDIEWAIEGEQLHLLQSRPITTLQTRPASPQDEGELNLWDNSNIAESYPGVTTPLTFSFARRAYEEVYRQFCSLMGVPQATIDDNATTFRRMLGLLQGQIYYNLLSWYRVLAMLPGYKLNRRFMEQMMGVKEGLPDELLDAQAPPSQGDRLKDGLRLLRTAAGLVVNFFTLPRRVDAFNQRLNQALGTERPDLSRTSVDELVTYYRELESQLLPRWDAPLVNDFFAMIFYGLLRKLSEKWCDDTQGTLQNELLANTGGVISVEPAARMRQMAQLAATDSTFVGLLCDSPLPEILAYLPQLPEFETQYQAYLDKFGDRCLEELKLESPTLRDDPLVLFRSIGQLARKAAQGQGGRGAGGQGSQTSIINYQLPITNYYLLFTIYYPLRYLIFNWILKNARVLLRNRENLRFERTRLFGRARHIFVELGHRFHTFNLLDDPRDIFYLEVEEALGIINGTTTTTQLKGLVALRQAEFDRYRAADPLPNRFQTRGIPYISYQLQVSSFGLKSSTQNSKPKTQNSKPKTPWTAQGRQNPKLKTLQGLGCSPGVVRGPVKIVTNPKTTTLRPGEILVAQRTDPGWIMLFSAAAGLLVEHGSLLSHAAIVSREMGLPAIVSISGITQWLTDGDYVEFDGSTGVVRKVFASDIL
jgi:pyruvate,water dikinase